MDKEIKLPYDYAVQNKVVLVFERSWTLYHYNSISTDIIQEVRRLIKMPVQTMQVSKSNYNVLLQTCYQDEKKADEAANKMDLKSVFQRVSLQVDSLNAENEEATLIFLITQILQDAVLQKAVDIHICFEGKNIYMRYRIDGSLQSVLAFKKEIATKLISQIKNMSDLNVDEKYLPQDGQMSLILSGKKVDCRVSVLPNTQGERMVLRILPASAIMKISSLGMTKDQETLLMDLVKLPQGMVFVTGPQNSGKTTTLYAALNELNKTNQNILTLEDPIENDIPGIGQTQIDIQRQLSFSVGLNALLKQDPDIVMISEFCDEYVTKTAMQTSLTGILVFSTLLANNAVGALIKLMKMNNNLFQVANAIKGIVAQRLVRQLCSHCKTPVIATNEMKKCLGQNIEKLLTLYNPKGCKQCNMTGYNGKRGIFEVIKIDETIRDLILKGGSEIEISQYAKKYFSSMIDILSQLVLSGEIDFNEIVCVLLSSGGGVYEKEYVSEYWDVFGMD